MNLDEAAERLRRAAEEEAARREERLERRLRLDIVDWAHRKFVLPETRRPIELAPQQQAFLRYGFRRLTEDDPRIQMFPSLGILVGHFPFTTVLCGQSKKGGKTTLGAVVARFIAEEQTTLGMVYCLGNDLTQARERQFKMTADSIEATPGAIHKSDLVILPGVAEVRKTYIKFLGSGTVMKPVAVDAPGEAGGNPDLTCWTELWAVELEDHIKFWMEMTPVPTKPDSIRWVDTYAGYEGESKVLEELYQRGKDGRRLTAGELAEATDTPLDAFEETGGDPDVKVPIWVNERARVLMLWDEGEVSHRMPWQRGPLGEAYYREQAQSLTPPQYARMQENKWVGAESEFVPIALWDACRDPWDEETKAGVPPLLPGDQTPLVLGVDAGTTSDSFAITAVARNRKDIKDVDVRAVREWKPPPGGAIDYSEPEAFLRAISKGGCALGHPQYAPFKLDEAGAAAAGKPVCPACRDGALMPPFKVMCIVYDSHQLVGMMQSLVRDGIAWCLDFDQGDLRLKADRALYLMIVKRELHHDGNEALRTHVQNAKARLQKEEESTMRIVKKAQDRKVDLLVALSMASYQCKELLLE